LKKYAFILLTATIVLLCGCSSYREIERGYLVTAIGFSIEDNIATLMLEAVSSSNVADKSSETIIMSGNGDSFDKAYSKIEKQLTKPLYFEQLGALVIADNLQYSQIKQLTDFYQKLPSVNYGIYLVKTSSVTKLFNSDAASGVLGYDVIGLIKNFEGLNNVNFSNQLYEINRGSVTTNINNLPIINTVDGKLRLDFADGGKYE